MPLDDHVKVMTFDQPGEALHHKVPPWREFRHARFEQRFARPIEERDAHAVAGDLNVDGLLLQILLKVQQAVKILGDGIEELQVDIDGLGGGLGGIVLV